MNSQDKQGATAFRSSQGNYLYADYSPLEDHRNLVEIIRNLVGLASKIEKIDLDNKKLGLLLSDTDTLRNDIVAAIKEIRTSTSHTMDAFYDNHADILKDDSLKAGTVVLAETKESLSGLLDGTQESFLEHHTKHKAAIVAQMSDNNHAAYRLVQAWLANDYNNLPQPIISHLFMTIELLISKDSSRGYDVWRTVSSSTASLPPSLQQETSRTDSGKNLANPADNNAAPPLHFSYTFDINTDGLEFWNYRRTVADLGIKDLMVPIGMKAPMSEKIKQSFKFGMGKDSEVSKDPEFVKVDNYSLVRIVMEGDRTLALHLSEDPRKAEGPVIRITYDVKDLIGESSSPRAGNPQQNEQKSTSMRPRIDYINQESAEVVAPMTNTDLLQIREIEAASDLSKMKMLGSSVLSKLMGFQAPGLIESKGSLQELKVVDTNVVMKSALAELNRVDRFFDLLESIASSYAPYVTKMKKTTPVQGELMLRQDLGGGQRKEFSLRIDDVASQLGNGENGLRIKSALGL